ncbi:hypothetical protein K438DRAFT_1727053 [Mycena galopus ATCC 62051]|nr:hypothetical protein K438DRAFT_1727053 [Mycena galopus ATCC 62051]
MQRRVHPSVPPASQNSPTPLGASTRANVVPPRPDYANLRRPSDNWLKNPGWIDGASEPPIFFTSQDEIVLTMLTFNPDHPMFHPPQAPGGPATENTPSVSPFASSTTSIDASSAANVTTLATDGVPGTAGYQVSVIASYSAPDTSKPASFRSKPALKAVKQSKLGFIDIDNMDRCTFINSILAVHDYANDYSAGVHRGPPFKISWTGSSGGKAGAPTIETDTEFEVVRASLRKKNAPAVVVKYNLDDMDGYRIAKKRALPEDGDENVELVHGTRVPRVEDFTPLDQLHGAMLLKLKAKWPCEKHAGENGDVGHCWIDVGSNHIGLNMRKLKMWASVIVAGEATIHEPPNVVEFDGLRDGRLTRPRGRGGPRAFHGSADAAAGSSETTALLTALLPILQTLAPQNKTPPRTTLPRAFPTTPRKPTSPVSPIPTPSSELHSCLDAFFKSKGINLLAAESALAAMGLTPDIISNVPIGRLGEITGAVEGHLWGLQSFSREWSAGLREKKRRLAAVST